MKNRTLIITYNKNSAFHGEDDILKRVESFKNIKTIESARKIVEKRQKSNIQNAEYKNSEGSIINID